MYVYRTYRSRVGAHDLQPVAPMRGQNPKSLRPSHFRNLNIEILNFLCRTVPHVSGIQ